MRLSLGQGSGEAVTSITIDTKLVGGMIREWTPQLRLKFRRVRRLSDHDFFEFCQDNRDARIEMDKNGDIEVTPKLVLAP